jgi:glycerol-3-phosphate acyltransferase PlsX
MPQSVRISLDAMGGDHGPGVVVPGAALALERHPDLRFLFFGDEALIRSLVDGRPRLREAAEIRHAPVAVRMDDKPSQALRAGRYKSSMWQAIQAVRDGEADAVVSAGNTGALMAMSKVCLKTMARIERPAIAALWPTVRGESVVLDVGATIGADAPHLVEMALMGAAMARIVFDLPRPSVGLLNVGTEEIKGIESVKEAGRVCASATTRISTTAASWRATTSGKAPWTWWSRKGSPATSPLRPRKARPGSSASTCARRWAAP